MKRGAAAWRSMPATRAPAVLGLPAFLALAACAPALREAPPLADLAGGAPPGDAAALAAMVRDADAAFDRRDVASVQAAARLYLRAAAASAGGAASPGDPGPSDARARALLAAIEADVWLSDHESDAKARAAVATEAVQAAQWCPSLAPGAPECDYWLGAALGVQARERTSTGLSALPRIVEAFTKAATAAPDLDSAGPDRALALLYLRAPGWPAGPGDQDKGLDHARRAMQRFPDYPPNRLALGEALLATGDAAAGLAAYREGRRLAAALADQGDKDAPEWIAEADDAMKSAQGGAGRGPAPHS